MQDRRQSPRQAVSQVTFTTRDQRFSVSDLSMAGAFLEDGGALGEIGEAHVGTLIVPGPAGSLPIGLRVTVARRDAERCGVRFAFQDTGQVVPLARFLEAQRRLQAAG